MNFKVKISNLKWAAAILLAAAAGCGKPKQIITAPLPPEPPALVARATGKSLAIVLPPPPKRTNDVALRYPPNIDPNDYWWNILESTNGGRTWFVALSNATGWPTVTASAPNAIFRAQGRRAL